MFNTGPVAAALRAEAGWPSGGTPALRIPPIPAAPHPHLPNQPGLRAEAPKVWGWEGQEMR